VDVEIEDNVGFLARLGAGSARVGELTCKGLAYPFKIVGTFFVGASHAILYGGGAASSEVALVSVGLFGVGGGFLVIGYGCERGGEHLSGYSHIEGISVHVEAVDDVGAE